MYKTVLFDLDGTLLNTIDDLAAAGNRLCGARGWPLHTVEQFKHLVGNGIPKLIERLTPPDQRSPQVLDRALRDFQADYQVHMQDLTSPYPGIPELLADLHRQGVCMAVLSNKADPLAREVVGDYFDLHLFASVHGLAAGMAPKPDPAGVNALMAELKADPRHTLYVGDSDVDVATARNAGIDCCGALWGFRGRRELEEAGATHLAADAAELGRVILAGPKGA